MYNIIKIAKLLEDAGLLIDCATETLKHKIKRQEGEFLGAMTAPMAASFIAPMDSSLMQPMASSLINGITGREVRIEGKGQEGGSLPFIAAPLVIKAIFGNGCNNMNHVNKIF